jgi:hypothetical protein
MELALAQASIELSFIITNYSGTVKGYPRRVLSQQDMLFHEREYLRLREVLQERAATSDLPAEPAGRDALNDLLLRLRERSLNSG